MQIRWKLKEMRTERGVSQLELARLSGVCKSNISAIETGTIKKPSFIDVLRIAKVLKVDIKELYKEIEK
ncbi:helix-turn-helix domain-containing protein [Fusobacterium ulcerans]|uniref:helix-turn-helix domain-containing protein n=1 Tax=Fusobacterium ulcerans TaxID=861 RepID=UPI0026729908|nr:helix-turn-helix transcriptional regulator [Fusobacterium ulcerans]